jgi:hypothetical protein
MAVRDRARELRGTEMTIRAYVLIETSSDEVDGSFAHGLQNCLAVGHRFRPSELMVHIECSEAADLNRAVTEDFANLPGVTRVTSCVVIGAD